MVRCGLEFEFLDVVVAEDGTSYASLVDGCTAEERRALSTVTGAPLSRLGE
jgi:hypothetical protein